MYIEVEKYQGLCDFSLYDAYRRNVSKIIADFQVQFATFKNAGYKVIGKDQALDEIEELKEELNDWKHRHDACEKKYNTLDKEVNALRAMILEHLNNKQ